MCAHLLHKPRARVVRPQRLRIVGGTCAGARRADGVQGRSVPCGHAHHGHERVVVHTVRARQCARERCGAWRHTRVMRSMRLSRGAVRHGTHPLCRKPTIRYKRRAPSHAYNQQLVLCDPATLCPSLALRSCSQAQCRVRARARRLYPPLASRNRIHDSACSGIRDGCLRPGRGRVAAGRSCASVRARHAPLPARPPAKWCVYRASVLVLRCLRPMGSVRGWCCALVPSALPRTQCPSSAPAATGAARSSARLA